MFWNIFSRKKKRIRKKKKLSPEEELRSVLKKYHLSNLELNILKVAEPCFSIDSLKEELSHKAGSSRIAGNPDLPKNWDWPRDDDGGYYTFLAQINLGELDMSKNCYLPNKGMLYFFLGSEEHVSAIHKVLYFDGDLVKLISTDMPDGKSYNDIYGDWREFQIVNPIFKKALSSVCHILMEIIPDKNNTIWANDESPEHKANDELNLLLSNERTQLGGLPKTYLGDPQMTAYLYKNGLDNLQYFHYRDLKDVDEEIAKKKKNKKNVKEVIELQKSRKELAKYKKEEKEHIKRSKDWVSLFILASEDKANMSWGDAGLLFFLIHKDDLKKRDFSNTFCTLECS